MLQLNKLVDVFLSKLREELLNQTYRICYLFKDQLYNTTYFGKPNDNPIDFIVISDKTFLIKYNKHAIFEIFPHGTILLKDERLITFKVLVRLIKPMNSITWEQRFEKILYELI